MERHPHQPAGCVGSPCPLLCLLCPPPRTVYCGFLVNQGREVGGGFSECGDLISPQQDLGFSQHSYSGRETEKELEPSQRGRRGHLTNNPFLMKPLLLLSLNTHLCLSSHPAFIFPFCSRCSSAGKRTTRKINSAQRGQTEEVEKTQSSQRQLTGRDKRRKPETHSGH